MVWYKNDFWFKAPSALEMSKVVDFKEQKNYKADCSTVSYNRIKDTKRSKWK